MTFFKPGYYWMWPEPRYEDGMLPKKMFYDAGTIIIDSFLTELPDRGPENFTVMHEVFHQRFQKRCFAHSSGDYKHETRKENLKLQSGRRYRTSLEICESQANFCAACFLMPKGLVTDWFNRLSQDRGILRTQNDIIAEMAVAFSVSKTAMHIRLNSLGLIK